MLEISQNVTRALQISAAIVAVIGGSLGIYLKLRTEAPAIEPLALRFQSERGVMTFDLENTTKASKLRPEDVENVLSLQITTRGVIVAWRKNLRDDCFLTSRNVWLSSWLNETFSIAEFSGAVVQGAMGDKMEVIGIKLPSILLAGEYQGHVLEVYNCGGQFLRYEYPPQKIRLRF